MEIFLKIGISLLLTGLLIYGFDFDEFQFIGFMGQMMRYVGAFTTLVYIIYVIFSI